MSRESTARSGQRFEAEGMVDAIRIVRESKTGDRATLRLTGPEEQIYPTAPAATGPAQVKAATGVARQGTAASQTTTEQFRFLKLPADVNAPIQVGDIVVWVERKLVALPRERRFRITADLTGTYSVSRRFTIQEVT